MSKVVDVVSNTNNADGLFARVSHVTVGSRVPRDRGHAGRVPLPCKSEDFLWDGLALIQRGDEQFINEPHVGGGNPVASSKGTSYFNDALGTTIGSKSNGKYSAAVLTAFGESLDAPQCEATSNFKHQTSNSQTFFTGKPLVEGLGHAFWMRNYRAGLAKWQSADPMGYPDGWNQLAYCGNAGVGAIDLLGCKTVSLDVIVEWDYCADPNMYGSGYLLTSVWDYLKGVWSLGSGIQGALGIRTFEDFVKIIKTDIEGKISDEARKELKQILGDSYGLWQSALLKEINKQDGLLGYTETPPTDEEVASAFQTKMGFSLESCKTYSIGSKTLVGVNMIIEKVAFGANYLKRVDQKWCVTVTYE